MLVFSAGNSKGLFLGILNYNPKNEQTLDVLLPFLSLSLSSSGNRVEGLRLRTLRMRLVRSCLCRQLSNLSIGPPPTATKTFDLTDAKVSHQIRPCPTGHLLA